MIKIICIGKLKEKYLSEFVDDYKNRVGKYHKISIIELKEEKTVDVEADNIMKYINKNDYVIACDIGGNQIDSVQLSKLIDMTFINHSTIVFVIGSSEGLSDKIKQISNYSLSLSKCTFPHGVFRAVLLEQIYRSFKIINNETYHK